MNNFTRSPSSINSTSCGSRQSLDLLVAVAREADLDVVLRHRAESVYRDSRFRRACPAAALEVFFLCEVGRKGDGVAAGGRLGLPTASRLIFWAADSIVSSRVGERSPTVTLSKP